MTSERSQLRVLSLIVEDHPGVLERVASQVRRRGFNIAALSVGPVAEGRSRMTVTVDAGTAEVDQVAKQVDRLVDVIDVHDLTDAALVARELLVARLNVTGQRREAAVSAVVRLGGRVIDAGEAGLIVEVSAEPAAVAGLVARLQSHGLAELARSGPVAMSKIQIQAPSRADSRKVENR